MSSSTTNSTKQWSKICLTSALEKLQQQGDDASSTSDVASLTALAVAAIEQLTTLCGGSDESLHEDRRELKRLSKTLRKMEPELEEKLSASSNNNNNKVAKTEEAEEKQQNVDLGQYATSGAFEDNDKKKSKFARLMGGGKKDHQGGGSEQHNTYALTKEKQLQMEAELEKEYELGRTHKGRKGLGA